MLVAINVACVNLAAVLTFLIQGIRPASWWRKEGARKATQVAILLWFVSIAIMTILMFVARSQGLFDESLTIGN